MRSPGPENKEVPAVRGGRTTRARNDDTKLKDNSAWQRNSRPAPRLPFRPLEVHVAEANGQGPPTPFSLADMTTSLIQESSPDWASCFAPIIADQKGGSLEESQPSQQVETQNRCLANSRMERSLDESHGGSEVGKKLQENGLIQMAASTRHPEETTATSRALLQQIQSMQRRIQKQDWMLRQSSGPARVGGYEDLIEDAAQELERTEEKLAKARADLLDLCQHSAEAFRLDSPQQAKQALPWAAMEPRIRAANDGEGQRLPTLELEEGNQLRAVNKAREAAEQQLAGLRRQNAEASAEGRGIQQSLAELTQELADVKSELSESQDDLRKLSRRQEAGRHQWFAFEAQITALKAEKSALERQIADGQEAWRVLKLHLRDERQLLASEKEARRLYIDGACLKDELLSQKLAEELKTQRLEIEALEEQKRNLSKAVEGCRADLEAAAAEQRQFAEESSRALTAAEAGKAAAALEFADQQRRRDALRKEAEELEEMQIRDRESAENQKAELKQLQTCCEEAAANILEVEGRCRIAASAAESAEKELSSLQASKIRLAEAVRDLQYHEKLHATSAAEALQSLDASLAQRQAEISELETQIAKARENKLELEELSEAAQTQLASLNTQIKSVERKLAAAAAEEAATKSCISRNAEQELLGEEMTRSAGRQRQAAADCENEGASAIVRGKSLPDLHSAVGPDLLLQELEDLRSELLGSPESGPKQALSISMTQQGHASQDAGRQLAAALYENEILGAEIERLNSLALQRQHLLKELSERTAAASPCEGSTAGMATPMFRGKEGCEQTASCGIPSPVSMQAAHLAYEEVAERLALERKDRQALEAEVFALQRRCADAEETAVEAKEKLTAAITAQNTIHDKLRRTSASHEKVADRLAGVLELHKELRQKQQESELECKKLTAQLEQSDSARAAAAARLAQLTGALQEREIKLLEQEQKLSAALEGEKTASKRSHGEIEELKAAFEAEKCRSARGLAEVAAKKAEIEAQLSSVRKQLMEAQKLSATQKDRANCCELSLVETRSQVEAAITELAKRLEEGQLERDKLQIGLHEAEAANEDLMSRLADCQEARAESSKRLDESQAARSELVQRLRDAEAAKSDLETRIAASIESASRFRTEALQLDSELTDLRGKFGTLREDHGTLGEELRRSREKEKKQTARLKAAVAAALSMEKEIVRLKPRIAVRVFEDTDSSGTHDAESSEAGSSPVHRPDKHTSKSALQAETTALEQRVTQQRSLLSALRKDIDQAKQQLQHAEAAREHLKLIQDELESLQRELPLLRQTACFSPEAARALHNTKQAHSTAVKRMENVQRQQANLGQNGHNDSFPARQEEASGGALRSASSDPSVPTQKEALALGSLLHAMRLASSEGVKTPEVVAAPEVRRTHRRTKSDGYADEGRQRSRTAKPRTLFRPQRELST